MEQQKTVASEFHSLEGQGTNLQDTGDHPNHIKLRPPQKLYPQYKGKLEIKTVPQNNPATLEPYTLGEEERRI